MDEPNDKPPAGAEEGGRRERRKRETRERLLEAAMTLFSEQGIYLTRLEDITERADLGKGAFYNYFDSKDALVAALLVKGVHRLQTEHFHAVGALSSVALRVAALVHAHDAFFRLHPGYSLLFHQARGLLELKRASADPLREAFATYLSRLADVLVPAVERVPSIDYLDMAAAVAGGITGYRSFRMATGVQPRPETSAAVLVTGVAGALGGR